MPASPPMWRDAERQNSAAAYHDPPRSTRFRALAIALPGTAVRRRALIALVPPVLAPLPDVPVHVVEAEGVCGTQASDRPRRRMRAVRVGAADRLAVIDRDVAGDRGTERKGGARAGAAGIFPLRLARQAEDAAGLARQPRAKFLHLVERHAHRRLPAAFLERALGELHRIGPRAHHGAPLIERHRVFAEIERRHGDLMLRPLGSLGSRARFRARPSGRCRPGSAPCANSRSCRGGCTNCCARARRRSITRPSLSSATVSKAKVRRTGPRTRDGALTWRIAWRICRVALTCPQHRHFSCPRPDSNQHGRVAVAATIDDDAGFLRCLAGESGALGSFRPSAVRSAQQASTSFQSQ